MVLVMETVITSWWERSKGREGVTKKSAQLKKLKKAQEEKHS